MFSYDLVLLCGLPGSLQSLAVCVNMRPCLAWCRQNTRGVIFRLLTFLLYVIVGGYECVVTGFVGMLVVLVCLVISRIALL